MDVMQITICSAISWISLNEKIGSREKRSVKKQRILTICSLNCKRTKRIYKKGNKYLHKINFQSSPAEVNTSLGIFSIRFVYSL